ncbi:hypothetical protein [Catenulispora rubra]|uniref:hypothetical protein n=1 Tax=Catenulispora rubra TaxID=280293 RepID=UPI00189257BD|nr:hypothetical protein [Catenulispora rubra]
MFRVIVYAFALSMVIGGSVGQLLDPPDAAGADVEALSGAEAVSEAEAEVDAVPEAVLSLDVEDPAAAPAAEPIVPEDAQPDSRIPATAANAPIPAMWRR